MILFFLILSIILNIFFVWYIIKLLKELIFISESVDSILSELHDFSGHLKGLHEMEAFYGDETLQSLIRHSEDTVDEIEKFEYMFSFTSDEEEEEIGQED